MVGSDVSRQHSPNSRHPIQCRQSRQPHAGQRGRSADVDAPVQSLDRAAIANRSLRVGQFTAAQEFLVSDNADLFVNSTFGWPVLTAMDLPSGGPNYPEATPGARLQIAASDQLTLRAAIFDGNPAGPGIGDPVGRDPYGVAFRVNDPPFFIVEMEYAYGQTGPRTAAIDPQPGRPEHVIRRSGRHRVRCFPAR